ncbi:helix-turn-helix transcriptional regulator [Streptomyces sp. NRRL F-5123]|uniref:helix-turn-helix transcriptional regulator n=1 Tax=Streptomyces sp. NRRL F-5123 TaxID=1463856 RepID=UPI000694B077|nr:helix-turn-helix transcriptional regulator [Streptomyces sp. NRRL F-5123]
MEDLGDFLRSRRARVAPKSAGLTSGARRRVPGLRREEVAQLAGISVEYYQRLEQGRSGAPSPEVLDALARVLRLDAVERAHLLSLAHPPRRTERAAPAGLRPELRRMIDHMGEVGAAVLNDHFDIVAANALGAVLFAPVLASPCAAPGTPPNLARHIFLDPRAADFYLDWDEVASVTAAQLRLVRGLLPQDAELAGLIAELDAGSPSFRANWATGDVELRAAGTKVVRHPEHGVLHLHYENLDLPGDPHHRVVVLSPEPDPATVAAWPRLTRADGSPASGRTPAGRRR